MLENLKLKEYLDTNSILYKKCAKTADLVSMRVGGTAKLTVLPKKVEQLIEILKLVKEEKWFLLGNGTNCYFSNDHFNGTIILTKFLNNISFFENGITAQCGASLNAVSKLALQNCMGGLEFLCGIPGTVGGGVYMNAAAFGSSISQVVSKSVVYMPFSDEKVELNATQHEFSTKSSIFKRERIVVLETTMLCSYEKPEIIEKNMFNFLNRRKLTQPIDKYSAGSTFVNPENISASYLIDKCGLKGYRIGGAEVSQKHAGFVINSNNATAEDIRALIEHIKNTVFDTFGVNLSEEIIYIE